MNEVVKISLTDVVITIFSIAILLFAYFTSGNGESPWDND